MESSRYLQLGYISIPQTAPKTENDLKINMGGYTFLAFSWNFWDKIWDKKFPKNKQPTEYQVLSGLFCSPYYSKLQHNFFF